MGLSRKFIVVLSLLIAITAYNLSSTREGIVVTTQTGQIKGIVSTSRDGREFYEWRGIPYAEPPVGELRFADPVPLSKPWQGVRDGSRYGAWCVQADFILGMVLGQEDCLYLNVYTPKLQEGPLERQEKLPVIVHVYGGGYSGKAGEMYPDYFMDEDVVFVTFNYRVAILGFFATGDANVRGNMGLKDQVLALKWVHDNIAAFGGDPANVAIHGISAGAAAVHQLTLSKLSKGLFHRSISHSGAATNPWGFLPMNKLLEKTNAVAKELNCPNTDSVQLVKCLRKLDAGVIIRAESKLFTYDHMLFFVTKTGLGFLPTVEAVDDEKAFMAKYPLRVAEDGEGTSAPHLFVHTTDEGTMTSSGLRRKKEVFDEFEANLELMVTMYFQLFDQKNAQTVAKRIIEYYNPPYASLSVEERIANYTKMLGDASFVFDIHESAELQRQHAPVYFVYYSKFGGPSFGPFVASIDPDNRFWSVLRGVIKEFVGSRLLGIESPRHGVEHAEDMMMQFSMLGIYTEKGSEFYQFSKDYVRFIVEFAKDPANAKFRGVRLPALPTNGTWKVLQIDDTPRLVTEPFEDRMTFLRSLKMRKG